MEIHIGDILGEENLVAFVYGNCGIFPPQEAFCYGGAVAQLHAGFQISAAGFQDDAHHALHPVDGVVLGQPADNTAVAAFLRFKIAGQKTGRAMVVGPVEFHAAGNPGAQRPDEAGLDDMLAVEEIVVGDFIPCGKNPAADFRKNQHVQILVFQMDSGVAAFDFPFPVYFQGDLVGIGAACGALVNPMLGEQRHFFLPRLRVGGEHKLFHANGCVGHENPPFMDT